MADEEVEEGLETEEGLGAEGAEERSEETPGEGEQGEESLLDVARKALDEATPEDSEEEPAAELDDDEPEDTETPADDEAKSEEEDAEPVEGDESKDAEISDAEMKGLSPRARRRMKKQQRKLLSERNEARDFARALGEPARQYAAVDGFLTEHNISMDDTAKALVLTAQIQAVRDGKLGPEVALAALEELQKPLRELTGQVIPADLQRRVDDGDIEATDAAEIVKARAEAERAKTFAESNQQRLQREAQERHVGQIRSSIGTWEQNKRAADPDYAKVEPLFLKLMRSKAAEAGPPADANVVVQRMDEAYAEARTYLAPATPTPREEIKRLPGGAVPMSKAKTEPTTLLEAAERGLAQAESRGR